MFLNYRESVVYIFILLFGFSCQQSTEQSDVPERASSDTIETIASLNKDSIDADHRGDDTVEREPGALERRLMDAGLVDVQSVDSTIQVELKYATKDNFVGVVLYDSLEKAYLQPEVAAKMKRAQQALHDIDSTLSLLIYDAVRPRSVQQKMWEALDTVPVRQRVKFVSNPKNGSIHNYGCAVDVTLVNRHTGRPLEMGAGFDDPRKIAYPRLEEAMLESGRLEKMHHMNRKLLRQAMGAGGFWVLPTEWWHFNAYSRDEAKQKFDPIE
ncbi:MAG: M15 family metallopeptidase [Bacteroidota bacterium]